MGGQPDRYARLCSASPPTGALAAARQPTTAATPEVVVREVIPTSATQAGAGARPRLFLLRIFGRHHRAAAARKLLVLTRP